MKKILGVAIVLALAVGTLAIVMLFRNNPNTEVVEPAVESTEQNETTQNATPITGTDTLQSLLARGQNLECVISYTQQIEGISAVTEGIYFTSQGKMRGDVVVPGMIDGSVSSMILTGGVMYYWTEIADETYGMKITLDELEQSKTTAGAPEAHEAVPLAATVSYSCKPWATIDGSIFEIPTTVLFKEYQAMVDVGMEYGTSYEEGTRSASECAACDELSRTEKAQCRAFLSCE